MFKMANISPATKRETCMRTGEAARRAALTALGEIVERLMPDGSQGEITINTGDGTGIQIFVAGLSLTAEWLA